MVNAQQTRSEAQAFQLVSPGSHQDPRVVSCRDVSSWRLAPELPGNCSNGHHTLHCSRYRSECFTVIGLSLTAVGDWGLGVQALVALVTLSLHLLQEIFMGIIQPNPAGLTYSIENSSSLTRWGGVGRSGEERPGDQAA